MENMLKKMRMEIDLIDSGIINLLWKRFTLVEEIWKYKKINNMEIIQEERWNELLNERKTLWKNLWISEKLISDIWESIHIEAIAREKL
jgi:chorismate mutase